jgi:hypothetical protein
MGVTFHLAALPLTGAAIAHTDDDPRASLVGEEEEERYEGFQDNRHR